jgi:hypothetical protein
VIENVLQKVEIGAHQGKEEGKRKKEECGREIREHGHRDDMMALTSRNFTKPENGGSALKRQDARDDVIQQRMYSPSHEICAPHLR